MIRIGMLAYAYTFQASKIKCKGGRRRRHWQLSRMSLAHRGIPVSFVSDAESRPMGSNAMHKSDGLR